MALRAPRRLPKSFNRPVSLTSRLLARTHCKTVDRRARRRHQSRMRFMKKCAQAVSMFTTEFKAWAIIGIGTIVASILLTLLFSPFFNVRQIHIKRQDPRIDPAEVQETLAPLFQERLLLVTKSQIVSMLEAQYPDIDSIEIVKDYPSTLSVKVILEPVMARVIIEDSSASELSQSGGLLETNSFSYITRSGYFVESPIKLSGSSPIPILRFTDWGIRPQHGTRTILPEFIERIFTARDTLRTEFGLVTLDIILYVRAQEFHIRTNKTTIWFDLKSPLPLQFQRFRQFLKTLSLDLAKLYIDVRIQDKIIFR